MPHCDYHRPTERPIHLLAIHSPSLLEKLAETFVGERFYFVVVAASHIVIIDQGVNDGFFGRFDSGGE